MAEDKTAKIAKRSENFPQWYQDVVREAELAEPAEVVRGCMVIRPHGYAIWEGIQRELDRRFKATGHENAYFPLLIPESFLKKEAEHVEGFAPEVAVVTHAGGRKLEEPYVIRPTSETIIGYFFAKWISSYRDLPLKLNQWANVVRWEMKPRLFLRTGEFLWQEGHTAHATAEEAIKEALDILGVYTDFAEQWMALPVIRGRKSDAEKFAGAVTTYAIEGMMQDGRALQAGTSHDLGQNFGKAFGVKFQTEQGGLEHVWQTSWGVSTRLIGGLVMAHSDDEGLVLPPKLAPVQVAIVPIFRKDHERQAVFEAGERMAAALRGVGLSTVFDGAEGLRPGAKFYKWERKGVPVRIELGPRDLAADQAVARRRTGGEREVLPLADLAARMPRILDEIQAQIYRRALEFREANTVLLEPGQPFLEALEPAPDRPLRFVRAHWCGSPACEAKIKHETRATIRSIPLHPEKDPGPCLVCGGPSEGRVVFARAY
jgi:prolyl-tRNA synthetase